MPERMIFKGDGAEITDKIAKFGAVSYQVANIGSVSVYEARKINLIAALIFVLGVVMIFVANNMQSQRSGDPSLFFLLAAVGVIGGILLQLFWPRKEFTFVLKTSSNDVHKIVSQNGEYLQQLQSSIELAFAERQ